LIATITIDALNEREQTTRAAVEHQRHSIAILNIGGMDRYAQQQAEVVLRRQGSCQASGSILSNALNFRCSAIAALVRSP
jgi:hypothetical protein